jgi:hypothetical protein
MKTAHSFSSNPPQIDLIPLQAAVCHDRPTHLDLLLKITPPALPHSLDRPPLNLGFVIELNRKMARSLRMFSMIWIKRATDG